MKDLDSMLAKLRTAPSATSLDDVQLRVLARIAERPRRARRASAVELLALTLALAAGMVGGGMPASADPAGSLTPLGSDFSLAPSTLLLGNP